MKKLIIFRMFMIIFVGLSTIMSFSVSDLIAQDTLCEKPVCRDGAEYDDGWCYSGPDPLTGAYSHWEAPSCPDGWNLDNARGLCVKEVCCEKRLCLSDEHYDGGGTRDGRPYGACVSSSGLGYISRTLRHCESGWDLDVERGVCIKRDCEVDTPDECSCPDYVEQASYAGDCNNRLPGTVCISYSDDYVWLVEDAIKDWREETCEGQAVTVAIGSKAEYHHILDTSCVKQVDSLVIPCPAKVHYGEDSEEVKILRAFRDNVLSQSPEGQEIIKLYYQLSPVVVQVMEEDEAFKQEVKEMIDGVLEMIGGYR